MVERVAKCAPLASATRYLGSLRQAFRAVLTLMTLSRFSRSCGPNEVSERQLEYLKFHIAWKRAGPRTRRYFKGKPPKFFDGPLDWLDGEKATIHIGSVQRASEEPYSDMTSINDGSDLVFGALVNVGCFLVIIATGALATEILVRRFR